MLCVESTAETLFFSETYTTGLLTSWRHQIPGELKGKKIKA